MGPDNGRRARAMPSAPGAGRVSMGMKGSVRSTDDAGARAKASLLIHLSTRAIDTKVETREGVVTVSSVAGSAAEKKQVTNLAGDIHGVTKVVNEMSIKEK